MSHAFEPMIPDEPISGSVSEKTPVPPAQDPGEKNAEAIGPSHPDSPTEPAPVPSTAASPAPNPVPPATSVPPVNPAAEVKIYKKKRKHNIKWKYKI